MYEQNGNINKETENKKEPKRNSGAIKKITEMKNSLQGFKGRLSRKKKELANLKIGQ